MGLHLLIPNAYAVRMTFSYCKLFAVHICILPFEEAQNLSFLSLRIALTALNLSELTGFSAYTIKLFILGFFELI